MRTPIFCAMAVAAAAAGAPALAQTVVQEITVYGRYTPRGEPPATLSQVVSYADLDLRRTPDQVVLRHRIDDAAVNVCNRLGAEQPNHTNLGKSCRDLAVADALDQMKGAVRYAMAHPPAYAVVVPVQPPPDTPYTAPVGDTAPTAAVEPAPPPQASASNASYNVATVTNGPVPDTPANRARLGGPMSNAGKRTTPAGN